MIPNDAVIGCTISKLEIKQKVYGGICLCNVILYIFEHDTKLCCRSNAICCKNRRTSVRASTAMVNRDYI